MKRLRKKIIHVNQHIIKANAKNGENNPPLTIKEAGKTTNAHQVDILGPCSVINRPHDPLSCGARVWIETYAEVIRDPGTVSPEPTGQVCEADDEGLLDLLPEEVETPAKWESWKEL